MPKNWVDIFAGQDQKGRPVHYGTLTGHLYTLPVVQMGLVTDKRTQQQEPVKLVHFKIKAHLISKSLAYYFGVAETVDDTDRNNNSYIKVTGWGERAIATLQKANLQPNDLVTITGFFSRHPHCQNGKTYPNYEIRMRNFFKNQ